MADEEGQSIREMAEQEGQDADAGELFPMGSLEGDETTLASLIKANHTVTVTVAMGSAEVPIRGGGLLDVNREHMLLVTVEPRKIETVPQREGDRLDGKTIVGYKERQTVTPIYVERVQGEGGAIIAAFADLLKADESAALAALDQMKARAQTALGAPV